MNIFNVNFIPPAMREDGSEFDKDLSNIITLDDINGDIHMHTTYSDGAFFYSRHGRSKYRKRL